MAAAPLQFPFQSLRNSLLACFLALLAIPPAAAQSTPPPTPRLKFIPETDLSLGVFGQLTPTRISSLNDDTRESAYVVQKMQGTSPSAGVLGVIHQAFSSWLGYNVNLGYSRFPERYAQGSTTKTKNPYNRPQSTFSQGSIGTNMYELTLAASIQGPGTGRWSTSAQLGAGALFFLPTRNDSPYSVEGRPTLVFGSALNYRLSPHLGLRAEYRGLFYKDPGFYNPNTPVPTSMFLTVTSEPTVSIVYVFGSGNTRHPRQMQ